MPSHRITVTLKPVPGWLKAYRRWRYPHGVWTEMQSRPWWWQWFAILVPYRWRWAHQRYAQRHGYFWIRCPLCDNHFGGHELRTVRGNPSSVPDPTDEARQLWVGICPRCTKAGLGVSG
jgi:hypothetical protein